MGTLVLAGDTSGSSTLTPVDAVTATITLPGATATLATLGANTFVGNQAITGTLSATGQISGTNTSSYQAGFSGWGPLESNSTAGAFYVGGATATAGRGEIHYWNNSATNPALYIDNTRNSADGRIIMRTRSSGTAVQVFMATDTGAQFGNATNLGSSVWFSGQSAASGFKNWVIDQGNFANGVLSFAYANSAGGVFGSSGTEAMRLTSIDGNYLLRLVNSQSSPLGIDMEFGTASPNNTANKFMYMGDASVARAYFYSNGGLANYSANNANLSDLREKKDIQLAGNYLEKICSIPVKTFLFNDQTDSDLNLGVIAQDVQAVAPELVLESDWGKQDEPKMRLSVYQTDFQYALMKSIQELAIKVSALEAK